MGRLGAWAEAVLRRLFPFREIGWEQYGERFTRFTLLWTPWLVIHLHIIDSPRRHARCHTHPFHFWTLILWGGYWETLPKGTFWRPAGSLLFRPARTVHNVVTAGTSWSLVFASWRVGPWRMVEELEGDCRTPAPPAPPAEEP
jgi:hypothetical protein